MCCSCRTPSEYLYLFVHDLFGLGKSFDHETDCSGRYTYPSLKTKDNFLKVKFKADTNNHKTKPMIVKRDQCVEIYFWTYKWLFLRDQKIEQWFFSFASSFFVFQTPEHDCAITERNGKDRSLRPHDAESDRCQQESPAGMYFTVLRSSLFHTYVQCWICLGVVCRNQGLN